jgi:hypothetical protein
MPDKEYTKECLYWDFDSLLESLEDGDGYCFLMNLRNGNPIVAKCLFNYYLNSRRMVSGRRFT